MDTRTTKSPSQDKMSKHILRRCSICKKFHASYRVPESGSRVKYLCLDCWKSIYGTPTPATKYEKSTKKDTLQDLEPTIIFSSKAEFYSRYRWDYDSGAIEAIVKIASVGIDTVIADIGAGTGILTHHFIDKVKNLYAIEPNEEMYQEAKKHLSSSCSIIKASAEATTLRDKSIDLILVAQAIHWFDPETARSEFLRIIKPGGWLAILKNYGTNDALNRAIEKLNTEQHRILPLCQAQSSHKQMLDFYFRGHNYQNLSFPFTIQQEWKQFIGSLISASYMPNPNHPKFPSLEKAAKNVFNEFSNSKYLTVAGETELVIGRLFLQD